LKPLDRVQPQRAFGVLPERHYAIGIDRHPALAQGIDEQRDTRLDRGSDDPQFLPTVRIIETDFRAGLNDQPPSVSSEPGGVDLLACWPAAQQCPGLRLDHGELLAADRG